MKWVCLLAWGLELVSTVHAEMQEYVVTSPCPKVWRYDTQKDSHWSESDLNLDVGTILQGAPSKTDPQQIVFVLAKRPHITYRVSKQCFTPENKIVTTETETNSTSPASTHALRRHRFLPGELIELPFASSYIGMVDSFVYATSKEVVIDENFDFSQAAVNLAIKGQVNISKKYAALYAIDGLINVGSDAGSALVLGLGATYRWKFGGLAELYRERGFLLSGILSFSFSKGYRFSPIVATINQVTTIAEAEDRADLFIETTGRDIEPKASASYAINETFGVTGILGFGLTHESSNLTDDDATSIRLGSMLTADLNPRTRVPLGFSLSFLLDREIAHHQTVKETSFVGQPNGTKVSTRSLALGVYETINDAFNFGIEGVVTGNNQDDSERSLSLGLRYYY